MNEAQRDRATGSTAEPGETTVTAAPEPESGGGHAVCEVAWCPLCTVVGAVQPVQPEMVDHLLKAGIELMLAFRSVLDTRAGRGEEPPAPPTLEKIDLG
jgi:hypothetical protein